MELGVHGRLLSNKKEKSPGLDLVWQRYEEFGSTVDDLIVNDDTSIKILVEALNLYRREVLDILEERKNSGQEKLRSSIMEEFFSKLFGNLISERISAPEEAVIIGSAESYVSLSFNPHDIQDLFTSPKAHVHTKDQDFVVGCRSWLKTAPKGSEVTSDGAVEIVIPVLAIECKTYLERNMLDSCAATARRLKAAMPYCLYLVAAEYLKMEKAYPELTDIDEVYILCKETNSKRESNKKNGLPPLDIDPELIVDLYDMVERHFSRIWWNPANALLRGKIIGRP